MKRLVWWSLTVLLILPWSRVAQAQLQFAGDAPRILSVEPRSHVFRHEFMLGVGVLPLDAFYTGLALSGSYTYHLSEFWAWEAVQGIYSYNIDTSLLSELLQFGVKPSVTTIPENNLFLTSSLILKPMAGKLAFLNRSNVQSDTFFALGAGTVLNSGNWDFAIDVGAGLHFWLTRAFAIRVDVRDYMVFTSAVPTSSLLVLISGTFGVGSPTLVSDDINDPG